jgi:hypothetical protein
MRMCPLHLQVGSSVAIACFVILLVKWCVRNKGFPLDQVNENGPVQVDHPRCQPMPATHLAQCRSLLRPGHPFDINNACTFVAHV